MWITSALFSLLLLTNLLIFPTAKAKKPATKRSLDSPKDLRETLAVKDHMSSEATKQHRTYAFIDLNQPPSLVFEVGDPHDTSRFAPKYGDGEEPKQTTVACTAEPHVVAKHPQNSQIPHRSERLSKEPVQSSTKKHEGIAAELKQALSPEGNSKNSDEVTIEMKGMEASHLDSHSLETVLPRETIAEAKRPLGPPLSPFAAKISWRLALNIFYKLESKPVPKKSLRTPMELVNQISCFTYTMVAKCITPQQWDKVEMIFLKFLDETFNQMAERGEAKPEAIDGAMMWISEMLYNTIDTSLLKQISETRNGIETTSPILMMMQHIAFGNIPELDNQKRQSAERFIPWLLKAWEDDDQKGYFGARKPKPREKSRDSLRQEKWAWWQLKGEEITRAARELPSITFNSQNRNRDSGRWMQLWHILLLDTKIKYTNRAEILSMGLKTSKEITIDKKQVAFKEILKLLHRNQLTKHHLISPKLPSDEHLIAVLKNYLEHEDLASAPQFWPDKISAFFECDMAGLLHSTKRKREKKGKTHDEITNRAEDQEKTIHLEKGSGGESEVQGKRRKYADIKDVMHRSIIQEKKKAVVSHQ